MSYREESISHRAIVPELAGDLVDLLGRVLVGVPSADEVLAEQDLLDVAVGRGRRGQRGDNGDGSELHVERIATQEPKKRMKGLEEKNE